MGIDALANARTSESSLACPMPDIRGRESGSSGVYAPMELTVVIGDTVRLARLWTSNVPAASPTPWQVADSLVARMEGDLIIPLDVGRTRVTGTVAGRAVCIGLATVLAGVHPTALEVTTVASALALTDGTRLDATVRYSNGLGLRVRDAVSWKSLDPTIASAADGGWVTPRAEGTARLVASLGRLADTTMLRVTNKRFESLVPSRAEEFVASIGVNIHLSYFDRVYGSEFRTIIIPRLQELGIRHLRDGGTSLPNEDWMREVYGRWRELATATGAKYTVIVSPRRTATGPGTNYGDVSHIRDLRDRIGADNIVAWEGLNEHDISGRGAFAQEGRTLQRALYTLVKGDPDMSARHRVLGPSMAFVSAASNVGDLSAYMDAGTIHPYDGGRAPASNLADHVSGVRPIAGSRPLVATEVGYHTSPISTNPWHWAVSEAVQAKYTLRAFLEFYNAGVQRTFAYELIDEGTDPSDMEFHFGLLRNDGSRKPAFTALRNLIALLGDRDAAAFAPHALRLSLSGDTAGVHRLLVEKGDGRRYLLLWQNSRSFDETTRTDLSASTRTVDVDFAIAPSIVSIYQPLTGAGALASYRSTSTIRVSVLDHPVLLELVN
ncbi:MAG: hypothetical protein ABIP66_08165 [Gemmatimonadaceae bacterium]